MHFFLQTSSFGGIFFAVLFPKMGDVVGKSEGSRSARSVHLFVRVKLWEPYLAKKNREGFRGRFLVTLLGCI